MDVVLETFFSMLSPLEIFEILDLLKRHCTFSGNISGSFRSQKVFLSLILFHTPDTCYFLDYHRGSGAR